MVSLLFLGRLEDAAGAPSRDLPLDGPAALADLLAQLPPLLAQALAAPRIRLALNGTLVAGEGLIVAPDDELAFLPPVSGG